MRLLLVVFLFLPSIVCPPPRREAAQEEMKQAEGTTTEETPHKPLYAFTYNKYLEEVVKILESDPKFNERIKDMKEEDIKAGNIADHIDDLDESVFNKLTRAKLEEVERLRTQIEEQIKQDGHAQNIKMPVHLDAQNWQTFGKEDLRMLIRQTVADMNAMDEQRKKEFKDYELRKKAEEDHKLAQMNAEERAKALADDEAKKARHNEHEKLKHPGSRDQLEEVWEEGDHMDKDSFDPKTFFRLHDINGDGYWNTEELEALFQMELDKMYNDTNPDDDPRERFEEMNRMREHVMTQMDKNQDKLISYDEFLADSEAQTPDKDPGWDDLGKEQAYTEEELKAFEEAYAKEQAPQQPSQQHQQQPVQAEVHYAQAPAQPVPQQPHPPGQQQQQQAQPSAPQQQIHELKNDPSYGI